MSRRLPVLRSAPADPRSRVGQELNEKWLLGRLLGVGGTAAVYEATHRNGRRAAVKVLANPTGHAGPMRRLAATESRIANAVGHAGVVTVLDDDVAEDGSVYLVMELLEGETLEARRQARGGRLSFEEARPLFEQVLDVLAAAHAAGIVHRDIKPDNVFITRSGQVKVLDFGLASAGREQSICEWFGTPGFIAPEQARGACCEIDARTDLWSAAATFFTVLTGRLVHEETTVEDLVAAAASDEVSLVSIDTVVSVHVEDVLRRALAFDKADRWADARSMLAALRSAASGAAHHDSRPRRTTRAPKTPAFIPGCRSTTRFFRFEDKGCGGASASSDPKMLCTLCPVCPGQLVTTRKTG